MSVAAALGHHVVDRHVAIPKRRALAQAAREGRFRQHQARHHDALARAATDVPRRVERDANAARANLFDFADPLHERMRHTGRIDQFGEVCSPRLRRHSVPQRLFAAAILGCATRVRLLALGNTVNGAAVGRCSSSRFQIGVSS